MSSDALAVLSRGSRTFSLAARLLPADRRADAAEVYRFCRHVDDLADGGLDPAAARAALDALDDELAAGRPGAAAGFLAVAERRRIDRAWPRDLVAGCRSDLGPVRVADDEALAAYAYRVAGTVGLMCCRVLGAPIEDAGPAAVDLGIAMQITNVCRDVVEDAARGRVYLPEDRLRAHGTSADAIVAGTADRDAVARVVLELLATADHRYARAEAGIRWLPRRVRPAVRVAARLYREIGEVLRARRGDVWRGRAVVPPLAKARVVLGALLAGPGW